MRTIFTFAVLLFCNYIFCQEQLLLDQNFNSCEIPSNWNVEINGNQEVIWYVGIPNNPESNGSSIDGSCMFIIDDDLTGENTGNYIFRAFSPFFNINGFPTVEVNVDVHFRNASGELFRVLLSNGTNEYELGRYENANFSGTQFSQYVTLRTDVSLYPGGQYQLIFEYDDKDQWGWWAGFDNVQVKGLGEGNVLYTETFNDCTIPPGWSLMNVNGDETWKFGLLENGNAWRSKSINGTCFAFFDDDILGEDESPSTVGLVSPSINLSDYRDYFLEFDLVFRQYDISEWFEAGLIVNNTRIPVKTYTSQVGGQQLDEFEHQNIDLSEFKAETARIYFLYHDGGAWGWWAGIDNVKLVGNGEINDRCSKSFALLLGDSLDYSTSKAFGDKSIPSLCNESFEKVLWYSFNAFQKDIYQIEISNDFNGIIEIFKGNNCSNLEPITCLDRDEYGFYGEKALNELDAGNYFLRVSGKKTEFGNESGSGKIFMSSADSLTEVPENNNCFAANSITLSSEEPHIGKNIEADFSAIIPSDNFRSRSDVWFKFTANNESNLVLEVVANFANNITVHTGTCDLLTEFATNYSGEELILDDLIAGEEYFIQVTGNFSSLEGDFEIFLKPSEELIENLDCASAVEAVIDEQCNQFDNRTGGFSGITPACDPLADSDRWYKFTAPASGILDYRFQADFMYTLSIYEITDCGAPTSIYCEREFHFCDGYQRVRNLNPAEEYYIQISSSGRVNSFNKGKGCLSMYDGSQNHMWEPIEMTLEMICASKDAVLIIPTATGGSGDFTYYGHGIVELIPSSSAFFVEAEDKDGCIAVEEGISPDCSEVQCNIFFELVVRDVTCHGKNNGSVELFATGGLGPYHLEGEVETTGSYALDLPPGMYQFTAVDAAGCSEDFEIVITEPNEIVWQLIQFVDESPEGGSVEVTFEGGEGQLDITWYKNGEEYSVGVDKIENLEAGDYYAEIKDENNCIITTDTYTVKLQTNLNDFNIESVWTAFPNPFSEHINFIFTGNVSGEGIIQVNTTLGVEIHKTTIFLNQGTQLSINTAGWPIGMYNLVINTENQKSHKIIVKTK